MHIHQDELKAVFVVFFLALEKLTCWRFGDKIKLLHRIFCRLTGHYSRLVFSSVKIASIRLGLITAPTFQSYITTFETVVDTLALLVVCSLFPRPVWLLHRSSLQPVFAFDHK